jgi:hypothetical protein
LKEAT